LARRLAAAVVPPVSLKVRIPLFEDLEEKREPTEV